MSYNQILKRKAVGEITKNGMNIAFSVATQTTHWTRPESVAEEVGERANPIVQGSKTALPTGTVELCIRYVRAIIQWANLLAIDKDPQGTRAS